MRKNFCSVIVLLILAAGCQTGKIKRTGKTPVIKKEKDGILLLTNHIIAEEISSNISILASGDIMMGNHLSPICKRKGNKFPFEPTVKYIREADIAIANLECPVSTRGTENKKKAYTYRADPKTLEGVAWAGFDACNVANNHTLDFGLTAFYDTMHNIRKYRMKPFGGGKNIEEANKPVFFTVDSVKIGIVGLQLIIYTSKKLAAENRPGVGTANERNIKKWVTKWKKKCDLLIVCYHWGNEYSHTPLYYQELVAHLCIDAGADAIIGNHPHVWQPIEFYKRKPILYSIGNFVFASYAQPSKGRLANESFLAVIYFRNKRFDHLKIIPLDVYNKRVQFVPQPMSFDQSKEMLTRLNRASTNLNGIMSITTEGHGILRPKD